MNIKPLSFAPFLIALCFAPAAAIAKQAERFIDGFPDVPYLEIISTIVGEPVMFDTNSGTVAETTIQFSVSTEQAIRAYGTALKGLGWTCSKTGLSLRCLREDNMVQFEPASGDNAASTLILRLEPRQ